MEKKGIYGILAGIAAGLIMAAGCITILVRIGFQLESVRFVIMVIAVCALPGCLRVLKKTPVRVFYAQLVMIAVSAVCLILYGTMAGYGSEGRNLIPQMGKAVLFSHGPALVWSLLAHKIIKKGEVDHGSEDTLE